MYNIHPAAAISNCQEFFYIKKVKSVVFDGKRVTLNAEVIILTTSGTDFMSESDTGHWKLNLAMMWFSQLVVLTGFAAAMPFIPLFFKKIGIVDEGQCGLYVSLFAFFSSPTLNLSISSLNSLSRASASMPSRRDFIDLYSLYFSIISKFFKIMF